MDSEKLPFHPVHFLLNLFLPYTDRYTHLHLKSPVPLGFKIIICQGVNEALVITQGKVHSLPFSELVSESHIPPTSNLFIRDLAATLY
jgi:hypothetical protein